MSGSFIYIPLQLAAHASPGLLPFTIHGKFNKDTLQPRCSLRETNNRDAAARKRSLFYKLSNQRYHNRRI